MLCKWGLFREKLDYNPVQADQIVINQIAQEMASNMSFAEAVDLWVVDSSGAYSLELFKRNTNPLATTLLFKAFVRYWQEQQAAYQRAPSGGPASNLISELPRQPDRKVCMTCGERVDGVIYCSEQCRPSAFLELYSQHSTRAETLTITEGFRTARSRFISPSADSCATYDTTQFAPPPYGLVDANPPTPKFVPTKEEPQEDSGIEELTLYSGPEKEPTRTSSVSPSLPNDSLNSYALSFLADVSEFHAASEYPASAN